MSDSDPRLRITIEGDATGAVEAGQQAKGALADVKAKTDSFNATAAGDETPKADGIPGGVRGLHMALRLIAREAGPAAGAAVSAAAALMTGGMFAAVFAVRELFQWLGTLKQKSDEFRDSQVQLWMAAVEGANAATEAAAEFNEQLEESKTISGELKTNFGDQIKLLGAEKEAHGKILDALEKEQLAEAGGDKEKEAAVRRRFDDLRGQGDLAFQTQRIGLLQQQLGQAQFAQFADTAGASFLEKMKERLIAQGPQLLADVAKVTGKPETAESIKGEAAAAQKIINQQLFDWGKFLGHPVDEQFVRTRLQGDPFPNREVVQAFATKDAIGAVDANSAAISKLNAGISKVESSIKTDAENIKATATQIPELQAELKINTDAANKQKIIKDVTAAGGVENLVASSANSYDQIQKGKGTPADAETLRILGEMVSLNNATPAQFNELLRKIHNSHKNQAAVIDFWQREFQTLESQLSHIAQHTFSGS